MKKLILLRKKHLFDCKSRAHNFENRLQIRIFRPRKPMVKLNKNRYLQKQRSPNEILEFTSSSLLVDDLL
jgi:hypothetical protein